MHINNIMEETRSRGEGRGHCELRHGLMSVKKFGAQATLNMMLCTYTYSTVQYIINSKYCTLIVISGRDWRGLDRRS